MSSIITPSSSYVAFNLNEDPLVGYDLKSLKNISDKIITDFYYRTLVPKSVYEISYHYGEGEVETKLPVSGQDLAVYRAKIPQIVLNVKNEVEKKLNKSISVENLLNELSENHDALFPFIF